MPAWAAGASVLVAATLVVAVPLGVVAGRWAWRVVADRLGVGYDPVVPLGGVVAVVALVLVLTNAAVAIAGRRAARLRPADALRAG